MKKIKSIFGLFRTFILSFALFMSLGHAQAAYNDEGTDYSTAASGSWIEDASKESFYMVNAIICMVKNSNGNSRPNGTWRALIDEVACGLNDNDDVAWADGIFVSTRASNTSDQEVVGYMTKVDGSKIIGTVTTNESTTSEFDLTLLFKFYFAYNPLYGTDDLSATGWSEGMPRGYTSITLEDYNGDGVDDTVVRTSEDFFGDTLGGIGVIYGGNPTGNTTNFLVNAPIWDGNGTVNTYAGALNDTEYFRQTYDSESETFGSNVCYAMDEPYQNVYRYGVYNSETGEELSISGSFGFTYETGASGESGRGYMGHWGTWFDNRDDKLSVNNTSQAITRESDSASLTLKWSPGRLYQKESSEVTLSVGEKFEVYDWSNAERYNIVWDTDKFNFANSLDLDNDVNVTGGTGSSGTTFTFDAANGGTTQISEGDWIKSERFDTWVGYLGEVDGNYKIYVEDNTQVKGHWTGGTGQGIDVTSETNLICASECPYTAIAPSMFGFGTYTSDDNVGDTYILTPFNESRDGIYPLALYKDSVAASNLVSLDVSSGNDWSNNTHADIWVGNFIPSDDIAGTCAADSDPDATNNMYNCDNRYAWKSGLRDWAQGIIVVDSENAAVTIEDPIAFTYTHAAANDRNNDNYPDANSLFNYEWKQTDWNEGTTVTSNEAHNTSLVDGLTVNLSYEGVGNLYGFPDRRTPNGRLQLVNLNDGTGITRKSDGSTYVVKALETGMLLNTKTCSGDLSVPDNFKNLSIIPSPTDHTVPTQLFNDAPTVTEIHVKQGEDIKLPSEVQANE